MLPPTRGGDPRIVGAMARSRLSARHCVWKRRALRARASDRDPIGAHQIGTRTPPRKLVLKRRHVLLLLVLLSTCSCFMKTNGLPIGLKSSARKERCPPSSRHAEHASWPTVTTLANLDRAAFRAAHCVARATTRRFRSRTSLRAMAWAGYRKLRGATLLIV